MSFRFSKSSLERMKGVNDDLVKVFHEALKVSPIDFGVPPLGGMRTQEVQKDLFKRELSKADGTANKSKHQKGEALDFFSYLNGRPSWDNIHLAMVAAVIMSTAKRLKDEGEISIDIRWGGTFGSNGSEFKGWDYPHIEIID